MIAYRKSPPPRGFARSEFEARAEKTQRLMAQHGFDALLFCTEPEVRYFSGFLTPFWQSPTRPWFLVVPRKGKPVAVIPEIGAPLMARTWLDDIRTWPAPRPDDEGVSLLADTLSGIGADKGRIGLPMGPESVLRMPLNDYTRLRTLLPATEFADATGLVRVLRMVKSHAEIGKIAEICRTVSDGFDTVPATVRSGQALGDVFTEFRIDLLRRGADEVPYLVGAAAPGGYGDVISPPGQSPLNDGDVLMMDTGAIWDGYFADFDRNYAVGSADEASRKAHATLWAATEAGLAAARPGITCAELYRSMQKAIIESGYAAGNVGRFGHGLGMQLTEWPSISANDNTVLEEGMVLTLEPGLEIAPGRGMVHEENFVVRDGSAQLLSRRAPPELPVIG